MAVGAGRDFAARGALPAAAPVRDRARPVRRLGLTARLLVTTVAFVVLAELLVCIPAVVTYRRDWLADRIAAARVAVVALEPDARGGRDDGVPERLLAEIGAHAIEWRSQESRRSRVLGAAPQQDPATVDLRRQGPGDLLVDAWQALAHAPGVPIRVVGQGFGADETVEILIDEAPLRQAVLRFSQQMLLSSLVVAVCAALLVFLVLHRILVRPIRRLTRNIAAFADDPGDAGRVIAPSGRGDEIGDTEVALARMQLALSGELRHKRRLAELGLSVSKINHELRNLLTTAQLLGDRLERTPDPVVRRVASRLAATLDRASRFCTSTLAYGRAAEQPARRCMTPLAPILAGLPDLAALARDARLSVRIEAPPTLRVDADPDQLARILANLVRNAVQALDAQAPREAVPTVTITASREARPEGDDVVITVTDNGPGLPGHVREHLFTPFRSSVRAGGTGLGLAIAAELAALNGGALEFDPTEAGTRFRIVIPDRIEARAA